VTGDGVLGSLSLPALLSLCCIGFGGVAGAAAVAGGSASTTALVTGATTGRGALVSGLVTAGTVLLVGLALRWWLRRTRADESERSPHD